MLAFLDRDPLVLHAEIDVVADIMARQLLQRLEAEIFLGPAEMALIPEVGVLKPEWNPAEPRLGKEDLELRIALEDAGEDQLGDADGGRQTEIADPFEKRPPQPPHDLRDLFWVFEGRL